MDAASGDSRGSMKGRMSLERKSGRELVATRSVDAPPRIVFEAWTKAELFRRWWVPESLGMTLLSCELDVRVGGGYALWFPQELTGAFGSPHVDASLGVEYYTKLRHVSVGLEADFQALLPPGPMAYGIHVYPTLKYTF